MKTKTKQPTVLQAAVLAAALVITLPLRMWQYSYIEPASGFWKEINAGVIAFFAVVAAAAVFFFVSAFAARKSIAFETSAIKLPGIGIISFLCAFSIIVSSYMEISALDVDTSAYTVTSTVNTSVIIYIQCAFALISAVYFLLLAVSFISGKSCGDKFKLLSLSPVLWCIVKLIVRFTRTISYVRVSDLMLEMLALAAYASFFMAFAQVNSKVNGKGLEWKLTAAGMTGAMLALICFIPRAVVTLMGNADAIYILSRADFADLGIALFIIANVLVRTIPAKSSEKVTV